MGDLGPFGPALFISAAIRKLVSLGVITEHRHVSFKTRLLYGRDLSWQVHQVCTEREGSIFLSVYTTPSFLAL